MIQVKVDRLFGDGIWSCRDSQGNEYFMHHGDLFKDQLVEVVISEGWVVPLVCDYSIDALIHDLIDEDGLVSLSDLKELPKSKAFDRIFVINGKWCFPHPDSKELLERCYAHELQQYTKLRLSQTRIRHQGYAIGRGLDFKQAFLKVMQKGQEVTKLYCEDSVRDSVDGHYAQYIILMKKLKKEEVSIQSWQAVGKTDKLSFIHGIINSSNLSFSHIDFAFHYSTFQEINTLLTEDNWKINLDKKEKLILINNADISSELAFELMKIFFPLDHLVEEYQYQST